MRDYFQDVFVSFKVVALILRLELFSFLKAILYLAMSVRFLFAFSLFLHLSSFSDWMTESKPSANPPERNLYPSTKQIMSLTSAVKNSLILATREVILMIASEKPLLPAAKGSRIEFLH